MRNAELARGKLEAPTPVVPSRPVAEKPKKRREPLILVILGLLVLAVLLVVLVGRTGDMSKEIPYKDIDSRIQRMEQKLAKLEAVEHRISQLEQKTGEHNLLLMDRTDRIEKALAAPKEAKAEEKKIASPRREVPAESKGEPIQPVPPLKEAKQIAYHQVVDGETLYRISRNYGLSVDELLKMNNLPPGSPIRKGQKLRVGPAEGR